MNSIQTIVDTLKDALLRKMGDEVDLIFQYGSFVRGTMHEYSDADVSWTPVREGVWESITVMVGDRLYDLYPIHWSRLEEMAEFRNVSASVLLYNRIIYQRTDAAAARLHALSARLISLQQPEARPEMVRRAMELFQETGYDYYLLQRDVERGNRTACMRQAQSILRSILHCLAVLNQACIDTRKLDQVLALPLLPAGFGEHALQLIDAVEPQAVLAATRALLDGMRDLLLSDQRRVLSTATTYADVFHAGYPELKRDLQGIMQGCDRRDLFSLKTSLLSLLHEVARRVAQVRTGVAFSTFNSFDEYEQELTSLGFPDLVSPLETREFDELHRRCHLFDQRLRELLHENAVNLNSFTDLAELRSYLDVRYPIQEQSRSQKD